MEDPVGCTRREDCDCESGACALRTRGGGCVAKGGNLRIVKAKLVYGENISQAPQFVQFGKRSGGDCSDVLAVSPAMQDGKRWDIPAEMHPAIEQGAIVLKDAKNKEAARVFLEFVKIRRARILAKVWFCVSGKTRKEEKG